MWIVHALEYHKLRVIAASEEIKINLDLGWVVFQMFRYSKDSV